MEENKEFEWYSTSSSDKDGICEQATEPDAQNSQDTVNESSDLVEDTVSEDSEDNADIEGENNTETEADGVKNEKTVNYTPSAASYYYTPGWSDVDQVAKDEEFIKKESKSSMVMGIIALVSIQMLCCFPAAIILGILSITKAIKVKKATGKLNGHSIVGLICGALGIVITVIMFFVFVGLMVFSIVQAEYSEELALSVQNVFFNFK